MIENFSERFIDIVNQIEKELPEPFQKQRMVDYDGNIAALSANFALSEEKKWLGIMSTGRSTHCHEFRLVFACPILDADELTKWWDFLCIQQSKLIPVDKDHEFSLVSLILVCGNISDIAIKNIKKLDNQLKYNKTGQSGWSNARMVAIDLSTQKIFASKTGDMLRDTLKNVNFNNAIS